MAPMALTKLQRAKLRPWRIEDVIDGWRLRVQLSTIAQSNRGDENAIRAEALKILKAALFRGRMIAKERLELGGGGIDCAELLAAVQDEVIRALFDFATTHVFRVHNRTASEKLSICATGGYGRFALAPSSDVDLLFVRPTKDSPWAEGIIEYVLYMLWDMGLKVGNASRTINDCIKAAKEDFTIRTAVLETRFICGDLEVYEELVARLRNELFKNTASEFVAAKLKERDTRHTRAGESRYMVEPNIKDGKGGLRDLHTMFWIAKYIHDVDIEKPETYVRKKIFTAKQMKTFMQSAEFLWKVRCHLHFLTGRPEERLTFDLQPEMAKLMGYGDRADNPAVERFMKHYFLVTKEVGALTRIMSAKLESDYIKSAPKGLTQFFAKKSKQIILDDDRFIIENGRIGFVDLNIPRKDKLSMLSIFILAAKHNCDIDPSSLAEIANLAPKDISLSRSAPAKKLFLEIMELETGPFSVLNIMNETGLLGRMVPEFGRIVGQTQFNMYHHYTVDEHTLRAIQIIGDIENNKLNSEAPIASEIFPKIANRRALYLAMLLHDVGKGIGDQQILGAKAARIVCKRLDLDEAETETIAWLVGHHLIMSDVAQKRDLGDPNTIAHFAAEVETLEKLRLLLVLTVADIRAVGPGVWNDWKAQLLRDLYQLTEAILRGGRADEKAIKSVLLAQVNQEREKIIKDKEVAEWFVALDDAYWLGFDENQHNWHHDEISKFLKSEKPVLIASRFEPNRSATAIMVIAPDRAGLFASVAGVFAAHNANVLDARVYTSKTGQAFDIFAIQGPLGEAFGAYDSRVIKSLKTDIKNCIEKEEKPKLIINNKPPKRLAAFNVEPFVLFDNKASLYDTVIEVSGLDRPGLLSDIALTLNDEVLNITSAHIGGVGERAEDSFYVRDAAGLKITEAHKQERLKQKLLEILTVNTPDAPVIVSTRKLAKARSSNRR